MFTLDEQDLIHARKIKGMLNSEAWKYLMEYYALNRETIIERIKQLPKSDVEVRRTALLGAVLHGFDEAIMIAHKVVQRAENYITTQEEERNAEPHTVGETEE